MGMLFILWGYILLLYIPVEKLMDTSISHMIAAKNILGTPGRFIMGIIVISGSLAAVHALFTTIAQQGSILFKIDKLPGNIKISKIIILSLALIIAGMMAGGMAGAEELETFIRASLILWLISYAVMSISDIRILNKPAKGYHTHLLLKKIIRVMCLLILGISILILTLMDDKPILIFKFLGVALFISLISGVLLRLKKNKPKY
jgi:L-asparagine transporter-like permease